MGFLQAVRSLGELTVQEQKKKDVMFPDIISYFQLPQSLDGSEDTKAHVIRIWLDVSDPKAEVLDVRGIKNVDRIEYAAIGDEIRIKERCLYRKPVGSNVSWRFSPVQRIGKGPPDPMKRLIGDDEQKQSQSDQKTLIDRICSTVLQDYEKMGFFTESSVSRIGDDLLLFAEKIANFWSDRKRSYILLFGVDDNDTFLYPGEVPVFIKYFKQKLEENTRKKPNKKPQTIQCSLCGEPTKKAFSLDKVFSFATFDKENFLPGIVKSTDSIEKVFPVCERCFELLSAGFEEMENRFVNFKVVNGIDLYVIPEVISDQRFFFERSFDTARDFFKNGIKQEQRLFSYLARQGEGLVYHFMFTEKKQAQIVVHSLVEDVPPSRLKKLEEMWIETTNVFGGDSDQSNRQNLDSAIRQIVSIFYSLAGRSVQDQYVMRENCMSVISNLLSNTLIRVDTIKMMMVSRFPGLFSDHEWIAPKNDNSRAGRWRLIGMAEIIDYFIRANRRLSV